MDAYSRISKLYEIENITTEEVMEKIEKFQERFGKVDEFGLWDIDRIQTYSGMQFNSKGQEDISLHGIQLYLAAKDHKYINDQVEVTWQLLRTIAHSIFVHAQVSDKYLYFALMYTTDHKSTVLPIK